jgi:predicted amidohydrolase
MCAYGWVGGSGGAGGRCATLADDLAFADLDPALLARVRADMPVLAHARPAIYRAGEDEDDDDVDGRGGSLS